MSEKPVEILVYEFLQEAVDDAADASALFGADVHDTVWQSMKKDRPRGLRITDAVGDIAPIGEGQVKEFDVEMQIVCFVKVEGVDKKDRGPALQAVFEIEKAVHKLIFDDQTLGGRVCDVVIEKSVRGYDSIDGNPYAVANISVVINPS